MNELERQVSETINPEEPWKLIEAFSHIVREHPEQVNKAAGIIQEQLEAHDVPVTMYKPDLYLSLPQHAEVRAGQKTFRAKPPSASASVPDGIKAELVYIPATFAKGAEDVFDTVDEDTANRTDVSGKIVLTEGFAMPANVSLFESKGALGLIAINPGQDIHWGTCTSVWGNPDLRSMDRIPGIPAVAVNNPDGQELIKLAEAGEQVTLVTEMEEGWFESRLPVVEIPGTEEPDKFVLLHGHYDSWDIGIGDNATGDATMLEIARVLWQHRDKLKRSVRVAWWPGHSTGRYAGSTWYADEFAIDLAENCVAQINCDSPGCRWATEYKDVTMMFEAEDHAAKVIKDIADKPLYAERAHQAGDYSFNNIGISSYFMLLSTMPDDLREEKGYYGVGGCGGNIAWHTENDTLEIADKDILLTDIKIYLLAVFRNANAKILPYNWRAISKNFGQTLERYQKAAGEKFDLSAAQEAVAAFDKRLERFYSEIDKEAVEPAAANQVQLELARLLVPLNFTQDARFFHDPALTIPALPDLAAAEQLEKYQGDHLGFAKTELKRGQNKVVATLRQATLRVDAALA